MDHLVRLETETRLEVLGLCTKCTCKNVLTFFILVTFFTFVNVFFRKFENKKLHKQRINMNKFQ